MALRLSNPVKRLIPIAAVVGVVAILALAAYVFLFSPVTVSGRVDHKTIVGIKDNTAYTLMVIVPGGFQFDDPSLEDLFLDKDANVTIDESLEWEILSCGYSEIRYLASMRLATKDPVNDIEPGETLAYFVKRDDFNELKFVLGYSFEVEKFKSATIKDVKGEFYVLVLCPDRH